MTNRIRPHQLEDLSRSKFRLVLPEHWVVRDKDKDYGIDVEVEIFDNEGRATGLVFWVQLKATEAKNEAKVKKVDLKVDSINYYQTLDIPVLIARYSAESDKFYCKWAHDIDLFFAKKGAKSFRVEFTDNDAWSEIFAEIVEEILKKIRCIKSGRIKFPIQTSFEVKTDDVIGIPRGVLLSGYRAALCDYSDLIDLRSESKEALLHAKLSNNDFTVQLVSINGCGFHRIEDRSADGFMEHLAVDTLIGCSVSLAHAGQFEMATQIALDKRLKSKLFKDKELLIHLLPYLLKTSHFCTVVDSIGEIINNYGDNLLEAVTTSICIANFQPNEEDKAHSMENLLIKCIAKYQRLEQTKTLGITYYNLGNHYRSRKLYRKAIVHYLKARKYESRYLDEAYYWTELGGALKWPPRMGQQVKVY